MAPFKKAAASMFLIAAGAWLAVAWVSRPDPSRDGDSERPALATAGADDRDLERPDANAPRRSQAAADGANPVVLQASDIPAAISPDGDGLDDFEAFMANPDAHPEAWLVNDGVLATKRLLAFGSREAFDRLMRAFEERVDGEGQAITAQVQQMLYMKSSLAEGAVTPHVVCGRRICIGRLQSYDPAALKDFMKDFNLSGMLDRSPQMRIGSSMWMKAEEVDGIFVQRILFTLGYGLDFEPVEPAEQKVD